MRVEMYVHVQRGLGLRGYMRASKLPVRVHRARSSHLTLPGRRSPIEPEWGFRPRETGPENFAEGAPASFGLFEAGGGRENNLLERERGHARLDDVRGGLPARGVRACLIRPLSLLSQVGGG